GSRLGHFDSGLVPNAVQFPDIELSISTNHQFCFDTVFNISASPMPWPQLHIDLGGSNMVVLSWDKTAVSLVLQECADLAKSGWTVVTNTPTDSGQQNQIVLLCSTGR